MSTTQESTNPAVSGSNAQNRIQNSINTTFGMPSGIHLSQFDGSDWSNWSGTIEAILTLHEAKDVILHSSIPTGVDADNWSSVQRRSKAYLRLYVKPDVYSLIASDADLPSFKDKWDKLKNTYGGASGSTTIFNLWIQITQAHLDDAQPMATQLAKINEARVALSNAKMGISDIQYCFILLNALPTSYKALASIILAAGPPKNLKHDEIIACIINEEGRWSGPSDSLLNLARKAPIKAQKKKKDHSDLMCHYCNKKGHIKQIAERRKKTSLIRKRRMRRQIIKETKQPIVTY